MTITIPGLKIVSEANAHEHWRVRQKRAKAQRRSVALYLRTMLPVRCCTLLALPVRVTMTRIGKRMIDSDNLESGLKAVRDQIAAEYGCGDSPRDPITWERCEQRIGEYGVEIRIEPQETP